MFYLSINSDFAKFLRLFSKAFSDMRSFVILLVIQTALMATVMQVLGTRFDDGGNFDLDEYDTMHNDFPLISSLGVAALSAYRNAVGDLNMPTYDFWAGQYLAALD